MLQPIAPREGATKACTTQLRAAILRGELAVGSRLPPERALAETLGVNRATVRAALHELESSGLVTARQGSGYSIHDFRASGGPDLLGPLADIAREEGRLYELSADLLSVRRHLARAVLERLVAHPLSVTSERRIGEKIDELEVLASASAPAHEIARADHAVLVSLLEATNSSVLRLFVNPAAQVLVRVPELERAMFAEPSRNVAGWRMLLVGLASGGVGGLDIGFVMAALEAIDQETLSRLKPPKRATKSAIPAETKLREPKSKSPRGANAKADANTDAKANKR